MAIGSVDAATANPTSPQNEPEPASNSSVAAQPQSRVLVAAPPSVAKPSIFNQFKPENSSPTLTLAASRDLEGDPTPPWVIDLKPNAIAQTPSVVVPTKPVTTKPNPKPNPTAQAPTTPRPSAPLPRPTTSTPTPTP
ncbi:MAG: hypothetical protein J0L70_31455, partial [Leptolyngbya sp. UWPOB_LEPTO1]|nr:hypothetical protein [Leptolyngbya sp. UWPOB_LEPTO1]